MPADREETVEEWKARVRSIGVSKQRPCKRVPVIADEGKFRGQEVGYHTHHADGRVDATSTKQDIWVNPNIVVSRTPPKET